MTNQPLHCVSCSSNRLERSGQIPAGHRFAANRLSEPLPPTELWRCTACHLRFRWPRLPAELLTELYQSGENELWDYDGRRRADFALASQRLASRAADGSILDIGCWDGCFLELLAKSWTRCGVEINPKAAERATQRGIEIIGNDLRSLATCDRQFDVVTAFDVVEHVDDPRVFLQEMIRLTKPRGWAIIGTGNADAWSWRLMKANYYYCVNPEHISFISPQWCHAAGQALDAEVTSVESYSHGQHRTWPNRIKQTTANIAYRLAPKLVEFMRSRGVGKLDVASHEAWRKVPPSWMTANDHMLVVFEKRIG